MSDLSRRDLLRASAGAAAIAVPMSALTSGSTATAAEAADAAALDAASAEQNHFGSGPVMFCVHNASRGEVSILHGKREVVVKDRRLVARILRAAGSAGR